MAKRWEWVSNLRDRERPPDYDVDTKGTEPAAANPGTGKPVTPKTRRLAPGDRVEVKVSPLDDGPGESPLTEGEWSVEICLDAVCSNTIALPVARR